MLTGCTRALAAVIPGKARLEYGIRSTSAATVASVLPRVLNCFEGAATASGCRLSIERTHFYLDVRPSRPLARAFDDFAQREWPADGSSSDDGGYEVGQEQPTGASTDFGNVSYRMPALHPMFLIPDAKPGDHPRASRLPSIDETGD